VKLCRRQTCNPVRERRHAVHEDPKPWQRRWCLEHTVERQRQREEQCHNRRSSLGVRHCSNAHMCECAGVDEELDHVQQYDTLTCRGLNAFNGVVVRAEDEETENDLVGDLDDDVGDDEGFPTVGFAWAFADLVQGALCDEQGHDL